MAHTVGVSHAGLFGGLSMLDYQQRLFERNQRLAADYQNTQALEKQNELSRAAMAGLQAPDLPQNANAPGVIEPGEALPTPAVAPTRERPKPAGFKPAPGLINPPWGGATAGYSGAPTTGRVPPRPNKTTSLHDGMTAAEQRKWDAQYGNKYDPKTGMPLETATQTKMQTPEQPGPVNLVPPGLMKNESGGNFGAQNAQGYVGRFQFGDARLEDAKRAGIIPPTMTKEQFRTDPAAQQKVEAWHFQDIRNFITQNGLDKYVGQSVKGIPITIEGMVDAAHLGGSAGMQKFITSGGAYDPADANGTTLSAYMQMGAGGQSAGTTVTAAMQGGQPTGMDAYADPNGIFSLPRTASELQTIQERYKPIRAMYDALLQQEQKNQQQAAARGVQYIPRNADALMQLQGQMQQLREGAKALRNPGALAILATPGREGEVSNFVDAVREATGAGDRFTMRAFKRPTGEIYYITYMDGQPSQQLSPEQLRTAFRPMLDKAYYDSIVAMNAAAAQDYREIRKYGAQAAIDTSKKSQETLDTTRGSIATEAAKAGLKANQATGELKLDPSGQGVYSQLGNGAVTYYRQVPNAATAEDYSKAMTPMVGTTTYPQAGLNPPNLANSEYFKFLQNIGQ